MRAASSARLSPLSLSLPHTPAAAPVPSLTARVARPRRIRHPPTLPRPHPPTRLATMGLPAVELPLSRLLLAAWVALTLVTAYKLRRTIR